MPSISKRQEIDHRTIKLIVGIVSLSLAGLTSAFATTAITSISASYYEGGWSRSLRPRCLSGRHVFDTDILLLRLLQARPTEGVPRGKCPRNDLRKLRSRYPGVNPRSCFRPLLWRRAVAAHPTP